MKNIGFIFCVLVILVALSADAAIPLALMVALAAAVLVGMNKGPRRPAGEWRLGGVAGCVDSKIREGNADTDWWYWDEFQPIDQRPTEAARSSCSLEAVSCGSDAISDDYVINPATGLPMVSGIGSVDVAGSPYGVDVHDHGTTLTDDWPQSCVNNGLETSSGHCPTSLGMDDSWPDSSWN